MTEPKTTLNSFQCIDALEVSLTIEKQGLIFYDKATKTASDPRVRAIFSRLADEEKEHIQSLQNKARFLQPVLAKKSFSRASKVENFIKNELEGKVFPDSGCGEREIKSDLEALDIGIEAEKRSIELLSRLMDDEKKMDVRVIFSHLLAEERKHLLMLEELKQTLNKKG